MCARSSPPIQESGIHSPFPYSRSQIMASAKSFAALPMTQSFRLRRLETLVTEANPGVVASQAEGRP